MSTLPASAWRITLVRALWAMEKSRLLVIVGNGGSLPWTVNSAGTDAMTVKVAAWASSTS